MTEIAKMPIIAPPNSASELNMPAMPTVVVTTVTHWTETLFSFTTERPPSFRIRSGEFAMIGLYDEAARPITRAYSIASANWDDRLAFYSIIVPDGTLTPRLRHIGVGDRIILRPKATGTLVLDRLRAGKRLYLLSSGTGIAPFIALIRDPETYDRFDEVILTHTCRTNAELAYGKHQVDSTLKHPLVGTMAMPALRYVPTVTRDSGRYVGRITHLLRTGQLHGWLDLPQFDPKYDRVMVCGSIGLNQDMKGILTKAGFCEGSLTNPAEFVVERAFVGEERVL